MILPRSERTALKRSIDALDVDKAGFAWSVAAGSAGLSSAVGLSAVSAWLITRASQMPPVLQLSVATTAVRALGVSKAVLRYINRLSSHRVALYGMSHLRTHVYETLANSSTDSVSALSRGDLLDRTGRDVDAVGDVVVKAIQPAFVAIVVSLVSCVIVGALSPLIGLILAACLICSGVVGPMLAAKGARIAEEAQVEDLAEVSAHALTMLDSPSELRVSGYLGRMEDALAATESRIFRHRDAAARPQAAAKALQTICMGISVAAAILIGVLQFAGGTLAATELAVCVLTPLAAYEAIEQLPEGAIQLVHSAKAASRIMELLDSATPEGADPVTPSALTESFVLTEPATPARPATPSAPAAATPTTAAPATRAGLLARDARIGWPGYPPVGGPFDFTFERGKTVAIVGRSGVGKSTLLYTLAGMLHPVSGSVTLDGRTIAALSRADVSRTLSLTAEDAHIFQTTVLENLRAARPDVTEREAVTYLVQVGLGTWLSELPDGVHTMLGEEGATISGGERRRLLLARALASPAEFLLLDEPGEHLDGETADRLIRDLLLAGKREGRGRTVILATHRLSSLDVADEVILLERTDTGTRIRDHGTHAELLARDEAYAWSAGQELL
ncbi:thiol reductant ABC exporter subunit CydC [Neoactinobaculum massilliense]|mgnify:CR=1 FL=1|uniref:thiol reductant ABC exporter subunit CydC n=1 Tax=Neoactinobaculum massilliense TaxID=2364794 RepID=UPI000F51FA75|nr:thiol reductant ABC exporter subunit CydC [Neoactinobaculum massilliense]